MQFTVVALCAKHTERRHHRHKTNKTRLWSQSIGQNEYSEEINCAPFPSFLKIEFHNTYWQTLRSSNGTYHMYGAYLDTRVMTYQGVNAKRNKSSFAPSVRIITVLNRFRPNVTIFCQLRFAEQAESVIVRTLPYLYMWRNKWGRHGNGTWQPYLITCVLPSVVRGLVPASVSLVERPCDRATNNLSVYYDAPLQRHRHEFAVCVKELDFLHKDKSVRLVEWIELVRLLGAHKIFIYKLRVHRNISMVLKYYEYLDVVSVIPTTRPDHTGPKDKPVQLIAYNDCLYRNMYLYQWLVLLDIDEVIIPLRDKNWSSLMRRVLPLSTPAPGKRRRSSYYASNLLFLDSLQQNHSWQDAVPCYMHMLQHVYRTREFTKRTHYVKAFHETDRVLTLHNHFPVNCLGERCSSYPLPTKLARLQHYRAECFKPLSQICKKLIKQPVRDRTLWRWRDPLVMRTNKALRALIHGNIIYNNTTCIMTTHRPAPIRMSSRLLRLRRKPTQTPNMLVSNYLISA
ncbi:uncharacterized protein LOC126370815 [Pectinophora gossypiella]|uniref:uncharacterized protein LOC126370815 n=1 Tax=Pectinophora gossypiella TaxID=13191 RepID=UPI00214E0AAB|nr:uncharacterized protein LOC126370815 [Pectinophora gossypiella]